VRLNAAQLTGRADDHIHYRDGVGLQAGTWSALETLRKDGLAAGFDLQVASGFRSFERQLAIWNGKARGEREVHDDSGRPLAMGALDSRGKIEAILRFSALPGASRHHWGTDLDVFDGLALPPGYRLKLTPEEVADDGLMGPFHRWLDDAIADEGQGFYRPYDQDRGGVAVERWHLSFAPLACCCEEDLTVDLLADALAGCEIELAADIQHWLPFIHARYIKMQSG
jgi:hypothetical protein